MLCTLFVERKRKIYANNKLTTNNICGHCKSKLSTKYNLNQHLKNCKIKKSLEEEKQKINNQIKL